MTRALALDDLGARRAASDWHGGQASALYALASSGATVARFPVDPADDDPLGPLLAEVERAEREADTARERERLRALAGYVRAAGPRGRQVGWSALSW